MQFPPVKTPKVLKFIFPNYVWDIKTPNKSLYLTFDDGPTPKITTWVLNTLKQYNAKATFFCIGSNIKKHPDIFKQIVKEGHQIGNHTQHHLKGWKTNIGSYLDDIKTCENALKNNLPKSKSTSLFRPPYGKITPKQGKAVLNKGYKIIMWDVLSFDWHKNIDEETCVNNVISKTKKGSIIVFHDSEKASKNMKYTLPKTLEYFTKKGFTFKTINL